MKNIKRSSLAFGLVFFIILGSYLAIHSRFTSGFDLTSSYSVSFKISEANYGDFDQDSLEDDIRVKAILRSNFVGPMLTFFYFDLTLPSGTIYSYSFQVALISDGSQIYITITSFKTATEAGWYKAKLVGVFICDDYLIVRTTSTIFDPPTETGFPGDPGIDLTITYTN